jgi:hypothetical protein
MTAWCEGEEAGETPALRKPEGRIARRGARAYICGLSGEGKKITARFADGVIEEEQC